MSGSNSLCPAKGFWLAHPVIADGVDDRVPTNRNPMGTDSQQPLRRIVLFSPPMGASPASHKPSAQLLTHLAHQQLLMLKLTDSNRSSFAARWFWNFEGAFSVKRAAPFIAWENMFPLDAGRAQLVKVR